MDGCLAPKIPEIPVSVDDDLLPVDSEQKRWVARVVLADVAGHPAPHEAHAQRLPLQVGLGELAGARFLISQPDSLCAAAHDRFDDPSSLSSVGRYRYPVPGEDRCCPLFVCTDCCIHASAPDVVGELLKEMRIPEDEMIRRNNQSHVAPGRKPPDLALKIGLLRRYDIVAAPGKTPADRGEHGGTLRCKFGIIAYGVFGEKSLHRSRGWLANT